MTERPKSRRPAPAKAPAEKKAVVREGKPDLETPESPVDLPEETLRDDEAPPETRDEFVERVVEASKNVEEPIVVRTIPLIVEEPKAAAPQNHYPGLSADEVTLIQAQHNL